MHRSRSHPIRHILSNIRNKTTCDNRTYSDRDARDLHPLQRLGVGPAAANGGAVDDGLVDAGDGGEVCRGGEVGKHEGFGGRRGEAGLHGVLAD